MDGLYQQRCENIIYGLTDQMTEDGKVWSKVVATVDALVYKTRREKMAEQYYTQSPVMVVRLAISSMCQSYRAFCHF